jgi:hypothetical protein
MDDNITGAEDVYWIHVAKDRYQWLTLVYIVMKLRVS